MFMVTNGVEDEGNEIIRSRPTFAAQGRRFVYAAGSQPLALKIYLDGKASPVQRNVFRLALSPDGQRVAYFAGLDATHRGIHCRRNGGDARWRLSAAR